MKLPSTIQPWTLVEFRGKTCLFPTSPQKSVVVRYGAPVFVEGGDSRSHKHS
jgi:hypothetical protein